MLYNGNGNAYLSLKKANLLMYKECRIDITARRSDWQGLSVPKLP